MAFQGRKRTRRTIPRQPDRAGDVLGRGARGVRSGACRNAALRRSLTKCCTLPQLPAPRAMPAEATLAQLATVAGLSAAQVQRWFARHLQLQALARSSTSGLRARAGDSAARTGAPVADAEVSTTTPVAPPLGAAGLTLRLHGPQANETSGRTPLRRAGGRSDTSEEEDEEGEEPDASGRVRVTRYRLPSHTLCLRRALPCATPAWSAWKLAAPASRRPGHAWRG